MAYTGTGLIDPFALLERIGLLSGWTVADLGCGSLGHFVFPAAEMVGSTGRVYAVDVERDALRRIEDEGRREQYWNIHPVWSDVEHPRQTHVPKDAADLTLIVNALYLSSKPACWAKEAWRITKAGGRVLVVDWHPDAKPLGPAATLRKEASVFSELFVREGWIASGDVMVAGDHHYAIICHKPDVPPETQVEFISHPVY